MLFLALVLTICFALIEALAGWYSGSLALLGDAGHMFTDGLALGMLPSLRYWHNAHRLDATATDLAVQSY